jgi:cytidylate kinase
LLRSINKFNLAEQGSCVIVGRTGFHVFRNNPYATKIFFIASRKARVKRVMEKFALDEDAASMRIDKVDEVRENYTKTVTSLSRYDARNYDFVFNATQFSNDLVAQFLSDNIKKKYSFFVK